MIDKKLTKFSSTPGFCTIDELHDVEKFLISYSDMTKTFKRGVGDMSTDETIEVYLSKVRWYIEHTLKNKS